MSAEHGLSLYIETAPLFDMEQTASGLNERVGDAPDAFRTFLNIRSAMIHEQILRYYDDSEVRGAALSNISDAYYRYGDYEKAVEYANKLPNLYKTRETALVRILKDDAEKNKIAKSALEPLVWLISYHLTDLSETENDPRYKEKIAGILDILFEGNENAFIKGIRKQADK